MSAVGFVGLGVMGRPMAENLLRAGVPLVVANRSAAARDALVALGASGAASATEVASRADTVITMLPDDAAVRAVVAGELIPAARPGTLLIDMSTVSPALSRELDDLARARGIASLDAPVSGGDAGARAGTLSIMVGGRAEDVARARPLLSVLGERIVHVGPSGTGQVLKACNQVLVAVTIAGVSEALVLGARHGVPAATVIDVLSGGLAANRVMELRRDNFVGHRFAPGFRVDLHHKDLEIALSSAGQVNVPMPQAALAQQLLRQLRAAGRGGEDHSAMLAAVEAQAGFRDGTEPSPDGTD